MSAPPQNTEAWLAWRKGGVGASELPIILGLDPWRSEYELALLKKGEVAPEPQNLAQGWGHRVEAAALEVYAEMTGRTVRRIRSTVTSRRYPHVYASLDGRVVGERRGVEVKLTRAWTEPPRRVVVQCQAQMGVVGLDAVDVVRVGMGYADPEVHTIERDDLAIAELLPLGEAWYLRYVLGPELPPIDGSVAASGYLSRFRGTEEREATDAQVETARRLLWLRQEEARIGKAAAQARNDLKASMAGLGTLTGPGIRVTWSGVRGRTSTAWGLVAKAYRELLRDHAADDLDAIESLHTSIGEPGDRLEVRETEGGAA